MDAQKVDGLIVFVSFIKYGKFYFSFDFQYLVKFTVQAIAVNTNHFVLSFVLCEIYSIYGNIQGSSVFFFFLTVYCRSGWFRQQCFYHSWCFYVSTFKTLIHQ